MGAIVFWTIIRTAILIPILWLLIDVIDFKFWWTLLAVSIYGVIIHPAVIQYKFFLEKNKKILHDTLCSSCKHFDETAILCLKHDKHPTEKSLPCEGVDWQPKENSNLKHKRKAK
jgi:hypothetical protein